jgi:hypothetical protein
LAGGFKPIQPLQASVVEEPPRTDPDIGYRAEAGTGGDE